MGKTVVEVAGRQDRVKGSIVCLNGIAGHPANRARVEGYTEVFAGYPDGKIENGANADWDPVKAGQTAAMLLATHASGPAD